MIKINLIREPKEAVAARRKAPAAPRAGLGTGDLILLIGLILSAGVSGFTYLRLNGQLKDLKAERTRLEQRKRELQKYIDEANKLEAKRNELRKQVDIIKQLKEQQQGPVRILDEVSKALPDVVWLTRLSVHGSEVSLEGASLNKNGVANYIANLDDSPFFSEPVLLEMRRGNHGEYTFTLRVTFHVTPQGQEGEGRG